MRIDENLLTVNEFSRPGSKLKSAKAVVLHWVANPGSTPAANRRFYESRKNGKLGYGSAHYFVGIDGQLLRVIPEDEIAYHCGSSDYDPASMKIYTDFARAKFGKYATPNSSPNWVTIGIELCHADDSGRFTAATLASARELCADLCRRYALDPKNDITTHNLIVGWKDCPRWFVKHPEDLKAFVETV
jgi:N-acetylmuramoyl-L-alanine amidase